jgi:hypothetical protein
MHWLYLAVAFSNTSPQLIWMILMVTFGLSGIAMLIFAKPFESLSYRYPLWNRGGPHRARFYRIMGTVWVLIAAVMAVPVVPILAHSISR